MKQVVQQSAVSSEELIDRLVREGRDQLRDVDHLIESLAPSELAHRAGPDRWAVGEHLHHLALTNREYMDAIEPVLKRAREKGWTDSGTLRETTLGRLFLRGLEPPVRMRLRTFRKIRPRSDLPPEAIRRAFHAEQRRFLSALDAARGLDLGRPKIRSPFVVILQMTLGEALQAVVLHNRRHLWNIESMLQGLGRERPPLGTPAERPPSEEAAEHRPSGEAAERPPSGEAPLTAD